MGFNCHVPDINRLLEAQAVLLREDHLFASPMRSGSVSGGSDGALNVGGRSERCELSNAVLASIAMVIRCHFAVIECMAR